MNSLATSIDHGVGCLMQKVLYFNSNKSLVLENDSVQLILILERPRAHIILSS